MKEDKNNMENKPKNQESISKVQISSDKMHLDESAQNAIEAQQTNLEQPKNIEVMVEVSSEPKTYQIDKAKILDFYNAMSKQQQQFVKKRKELKNNRKKIQAQKNKKQQKVIKQVTKSQDVLLQKFDEKTRQKMQILTQQFDKAIKNLYSTDPIHVLRYQQKRTLFKYSVIAFYELEIIGMAKLQEKEKKILLQFKDIPKIYIQELVNQIDQAMIKFKNGNDKNHVTVYLKTQWDYLNKQMAEPNNLQLRRKVVTKIYPAAQLATMDEIFFYAKQKRQIQLNKKKKFLAEHVAEQKEKPQIPQEQILLSYQFLDKVNNNTINSPLAPKNLPQLIAQTKNILTSTPQRMKQRIQQLEGQQRFRLLNNFLKYY